MVTPFALFVYPGIFYYWYYISVMRANYANYEPEKSNEVPGEVLCDVYTESPHVSPIIKNLVQFKNLVFFKSKYLTPEG